MRKRLAYYLGVCLFVGLSLSACENAIEPLAEDSDSYVFINGFLDTAADSQFVRLNGLRPSILGAPRDLEGVRVTTFDLTSQTEVVWKDSTIVLDSGEDATIYVGLFGAEENHIYDFVVERPGFESATARTAIPVTPVIYAEEPTGNAILLTQSIFLNHLFTEPHTLQVKYDVFVPERGRLESFFLPYAGDAKSYSNGKTFDVFLYRDQEVINFSLGRTDTDPPLGLRRIAVQVDVESEEWFNRTDPTNLHFAHGFFGSVGRFDLGWALSSDTVQKMEFVDEQHLPPGN